MEKPLLLLCDSNEDFRLALANALNPHYRVIQCGDGKQALLILRSQQPRILVLDPTLPELDGLSLLESALREEILPTVMIITGFINDYILETATRLGVAYIMSKPCDLSAAVHRIRDLNRNSVPQDRLSRTKAADILQQLGFSAKHTGSHYLPDAILLMAKEPGQPVTKVLYPAVAKLHGCSPENVERSIRSSIAAARRHGDIEVWKQYFPASADARPTNAELITQLALRLSEGDWKGMISHYPHIL